MNSSEMYDKKYLYKCLLWVFVVFGLMRVTGGAGFAIVIPMVIFSALTRKMEALLFWLLVAVSTVVANPHVVYKSGGFAFMQRGVMVFLGCVMSVSVMSYPLHGVIRQYTWMLSYILYMVLPSLVGWNPKISFLKLILFTLVYCSYVGVANQVGVNPQVSTRRIRSVMLAMAIVFILGSVALVPFPGLGQMHPEDYQGQADMPSFTSLFMGMSSQPQCLGPLVSMVSVVLLGDLLFSIKRVNWLYIVLLCCVPYLLYLTSSRTGMATYISGHLFLLWVFMNARGVRNSWKSRVMTVATGILLLSVLTAAFVPSVQTRAVKFLMKTTSEDVGPVTKEAITKTRMGLVEESLRNFRKSPLIGNGFQVAERMMRQKGGGLSILSAPIEKGVWVTAVLEEGGVIGWGIFVVFLIASITTSIKRKAYIGASCLFVFAVSNLGEFTFFSMSYLGGFCWAMVFVGLMLDMRKMRDENEELRRQMVFEQLAVSG